MRSASKVNAAKKNSTHKSKSKISRRKNRKFASVNYRWLLVELSLRKFNFHHVPTQTVCRLLGQQTYRSYMSVCIPDKNRRQIVSSNESLIVLVILSRLNRWFYRVSASISATNLCISFSHSRSQSDRNCNRWQCGACRNRSIS